MGPLCPKKTMLRPHCGLDTVMTQAQNLQRFREMFSIYKKDSSLNISAGAWDALQSRDQRRFCI